MSVVLYPVSVELLLDVRSMEDVRKSWVYQTAAKTTRLDIYVDMEQTRDGILLFANSQQQSQQQQQLVPTAQLPERVPDAVPVTTLPPAPSSVNNNSGDALATNLKLLIEESFQALVDAQMSRDSHQGSVDVALEKYRAADEGFERAARLVPDGRTRQLFQERRQEIQKVICRLEETIETQRPRQQPSASETLLMGITGMGFPDAPLHTVSTADSDAVGSSSSSVPTAPSTTSELDERLERLKNFAAQQEVERAQREHKPASDDLRLRLQALRNENHLVPSAESLHERFQRLRGGGNANANAFSRTNEAQETDETLMFNRQSSVDRIIQQVQEEIALGIVDADEELEEENESRSSKSDSEEYDESGESSSEDSATDRREPGKASKKTASVRKARR